MTNYISNAFSLQMVDDNAVITKSAINPADIPADVTSAVGHADTANVISNLLGFKVPFNRVNLKLTKDDVLFVAQVMGGRLPEGATTLPEGVSIRFFRITIS